MSTTIAIPIVEPPGVAAALHALALDDVRCVEDIATVTEPWPHGIWHLYREGRSTRTTEITCGEGELAIRIFALASDDDIALAIALARVIASHAHAATVDAESFGAVVPARLDELYDAAWIAAQAESGIRAIEVLVDEGRGPIEVPGPRRAWCVGTRVLAELGPAPTAAAIWAAMRRVQWLPIRTAGMFVTTSKANPDREVKLAVWTGDEIVFPAVEYAALSLEQVGAPPEVIVVLAARVPELAGAHWQPLDERQGIVRAFEPAAWRTLFERARAVATTV